MRPSFSPSSYICSPIFIFNFSLKKLAATAAKKADNARKRALDNPYPSTPSKKSRTAYYDLDDGADYEYEDDYMYKDDSDFSSFGWYGSPARAAPSGVPKF